ncbi:MAG TPA: hypothetical protein PLQ17_02085, partial [Saprospiraceae bacterium]|nr:hypothetical protein [Saprospiraceae bacterium]
ESGTQDKFAYTDSVFVKFEKKTTVIEKIIKEKKKKPEKVKPEKPKKEKAKKVKKEKEKKQKDDVEEEEVKKDGLNEVIESDTEQTEESAEEAKEKIKEEETTDETEETEEDKEEPKAEAVEINDDEEEVAPEEPKKKITIIEENFATVRFLARYKDGREEKEEQVFKINKLVQKEDKSPEANDEKFQITVVPVSGAPFQVYLNADKSVNSVEFKDRKLFVRGN